MIHRSPNSLTSMIFNAQIALKIHQKALAAGALPRTHWGSSQRSPRPLVVYWGSAPDPAGGADGAPPDPSPAGEPPTFLCPL
jgi:hypothetical protein